MAPATRQVLVSTAANGSADPCTGLTPARIDGLTKMMYDITTNVVAPAIVSRANVVPRAAKPKDRSRSPSPRNVAASVLIVAVPPRFVNDP
jgi:hypothetical protein